MSGKLKNCAVDIGEGRHFLYVRMIVIALDYGVRACQLFIHSIITRKYELRFQISWSYSSHSKCNFFFTSTIPDRLQIRMFHSSRLTTCIAT